MIHDFVENFSLDKINYQKNVSFYEVIFRYNIC